MRQIKESRGVVISPPPPAGKRTERSTGNDGALSIVPDRNFSVRIKDGGPWPSLNFKLKNTVGYIALLENSLRARARELFAPARGVFYAARQKSDFQIFCARTAAHIY